MKIARAVLLPVAVLLVVMLSVGCGKKDAPLQHFSYDVAGRAASLDPQFTSDAASQLIIQNCFEGLLRYSPGGELENGVIENFTISSDGRVYTFSISPNAKWQDGSDVTADDFMFTFERIFSHEAPSPYAADFLSIQNGNEVLSGELPLSALGVRSQGPRSLVITLNTPNDLFPALLASSAAMPCKRDFFATQRGSYGLSVNALITNGPFTITRWEQGRVILKPSQSYHEPTTVESVTLHLGVSDREGRFKSGRTDFVLTSGDTTFEEPYHTESFYDKTGLLIFNQKVEPYGHADVRKAIVSAIDAAAIAALLEEDEWRHPAEGILPPVTALLANNYRDIAGSPAQPEFSPDARAVLFSAYREINLASLPQTDLLLTEGVDMLIGSSLQRVWQQRLSAYINILPVSSDELMRRVLTGDYKMAILPITGAASSPYGILYTLGGRGGDNLTGSNIEGIEIQLKSATQAASATESALKYLAAEEIMLSGFNVWPIYYTSSRFVSSQEVSGAYYLPQNGMVYFKNAVRE